MQLETWDKYGVPGMMLAAALGFAVREFWPWMKGRKKRDDERQDKRADQEARLTAAQVELLTSLLRETRTREMELTDKLFQLVMSGQLQTHEKLTRVHDLLVEEFGCVNGHFLTIEKRLELLEEKK